MKREQSRLRQSWLAAALLLCPAAMLLVVLLTPVAAQDIRGLERCMAEKQMERRTGCLQANVEFLQQALVKQEQAQIKFARETQDKIAASDRDLAAARAEIAALKSAMEKLTGELTQMKASATPNAKKK